MNPNLKFLVKIIASIYSRGQKRNTTVKRGGGFVMMWACISVSSVGLLVETDGTVIAERCSEMCWATASFFSKTMSSNILLMQ